MWCISFYQTFSKRSYMAIWKGFFSGFGTEQGIGLDELYGAFQLHDKPDSRSASFVKYELVTKCGRWQILHKTALYIMPLGMGKWRRDKTTFQFAFYKRTRPLGSKRGRKNEQILSPAILQFSQYAPEWLCIQRKQDGIWQQEAPMSWTHISYCSSEIRHQVTIPQLSKYGIADSCS